MQQIDDLLRRPGRHEHAGDGFGLLVLDAHFVERRDVGQRLQALLVGDAERADFPSLISATVADRAARDRHVVAEQRLRHRPAAGERHGDEVDLEIVLELLDRQRRRGAGAGRADAVLAGLFLEQLDQVLHVLGREVSD